MAKIQAIYHRLTSPSYRNDKGCPNANYPTIPIIYPSAPVRRQRLNASRTPSRTWMHDLSLLTMNYRVPFTRDLRFLRYPAITPFLKKKKGRNYEDKIEYQRVKDSPLQDDYCKRLFHLNSIFLLSFQLLY